MKDLSSVVTLVMTVFGVLAFLFFAVSAVEWFYCHNLLERIKISACLFVIIIGLYALILFLE